LPRCPGNFCINIIGYKTLASFIGYKESNLLVLLIAFLPMRDYYSSVERVRRGLGGWLIAELLVP